MPLHHLDPAGSPPAHAMDTSEWASYRLAASVRAFSRRTKAVIDDKLSLSLTLLRAGELAEARRLIEDVESQIRREEAALLHRIHELQASSVGVHRQEVGPPSR